MAFSTCAAFIAFAVLSVLGGQGMPIRGSHVTTLTMHDGSIGEIARKVKMLSDNGRAQHITERELDYRRTCAGLHQPLERLRVHAVKQRLDPKIHIQLDRQFLERGSGDWFNVSWSGVTDPRYDDWIALVAPSDANLSETAPAKWKFAAGDPKHVITGSGSLRFRLISYRADVAFALMRNGFDTPQEVARSQPIKRSLSSKPCSSAGAVTVRLLNPNEPLQVHLALTGSPSEMRVQWNTREAGSTPQVRWGPKSVKYDDRDGLGFAGGSDGPAYPSTAAADTSRYGIEDLCGGAATSAGWVDAGHHHVALLTGLRPATRYYYRVGDPDGDGGWSPEFSFLSSPEISPDETVHILAVADMGQAEVDGSLEGSEMIPSLNTTRRMIEEAAASPYSLLLHIGDISYARGYSTQWDNFMHQIEPLAARMPYMVAPGNHERDWPGSGDFFGVEDSGGECGVAYERRFPMPYPGKDKQWYAFAYGPIFFILYSTEHPVGPGSEQYEFIVQALRGVDRRRTPWLVVAGHRPIYVASTNANWPDGDQPVSELLRDALEDLFLEHAVDMTLQGHHHSYQRTCPLYRGVCQPSNDDGTAAAPVHVVLGHAGAGLSLNIVDPLPAWLENLGLWWGYVRMKVSRSQLLVEVVGDDDGHFMDSFELRKPANWGKKYMEVHTRSL
ncbi:hypothetical protein VOLCADRAFT_105635 [Volvox carteri f. nagariensis]|uniref:Purple acid phosphatase n=1 Tax=Volvox carteri f. nagariensis TaxID=3068 RepID=D8U202_VOLCA|nr:uncharacterized protein VOLCADRAFT_105635 [Volvox carteri f. nagariensis]EFJ46276.1 hypothetical protein VOLCADRAFT_105635 [Volvox carteri f. nagariensis]|eukprot:XP_002952723.1 hypothetical protein VOLCADRAFT_105635 [Volvox carteri f. nagariensis]